MSDLLLLVSDAVAQRTHAAETLAVAHPPARRAPLDWRHAYVLRYDPAPGPKASLTPHTDDAEVTLNVGLSRQPGSFEGGDLLLGGVRGGQSGPSNWLDPTVRRAHV